MGKIECISACIVTYNDANTVRNACRSIIENTKKYPLTLYVIDNASSVSIREALKDIEGITIIENQKNIGFGAAHNKVLEEPLGDYHFVINPDIEIKSDVLSKMADFLEENSDIALAMPRILNADGSEQKLPKEVPTFKRLFLGRLSFLGGPFRKIRDEYTWANRPIEKVTDIDFCSGCFFCIKGSLFKTLGGFDERFFMYLEDADISIRAKKHGRVVITPDISVVHLWKRESSKSIKYLLIHIASSIKFLFRKRKIMI